MKNETNLVFSDWLLFIRNGVWAALSDQQPLLQLPGIGNAGRLSVAAELF